MEVCVYLAYRHHIRLCVSPSRLIRVLIQVLASMILKIGDATG